MQKLSLMTGNHLSADFVSSTRKTKLTKLNFVA
jgi:hypothetical protein